MIRFESSGAAAPELDELISSSLDAASLLLVTVQPAPPAEWTARTAIALADRVAALSPTILIDVVPESTLHDLLDAENFEGVADVFQFGASLKHVMQPARDHRFVLVPAGAAAEYETILSDPKWRRLLGDAQAGGHFVIVLADGQTPGLDHIAARVGRVVALSTEEDVGVDGLRIAEVIGPFPPKVVVMPAPPPPARELSPDEQFEAIKLPRNAAREALIADLRARQRAALMTPPPPLDPVPPETPPSSAPSSRAPGERTTRTAPPRPTPSITEPTFSHAPGKRGVKSRRALFWALSLAVIAAFVVGGGLVVRRYLQVSETTPPDSVPVTPAAPRPVAVPLAYSVAVEAHQQLPMAVERVNALRSEEPDMEFYISPGPVEDVIYYRVMAGPVADSAAAGVLMRKLIEKGHKTGTTQWDVREATLAFLIGEYASRGEAEKRVEEAIDKAIPSYIIPLPAPNGPTRYRVYAGAYAGFAEADVMRQLLKSAGLPDSLVVRMGPREQR